MKVDASQLKFEPFQGPGLDLMVLRGHPEHELLFIATQVMNQAGLKDGKRQIQRYKDKEGMYQVRQLVHNLSTLDPESDTISADHPIAPFVSSTKKLIGPRWKDGWLCTESVMYQMLLRGHSPCADAFSHWVCEIVLPTLRRTGTYTYLPEHGIESLSSAIERYKARAALEPAYASKWANMADKLSGQITDAKVDKLPSLGTS